MQKEDQLSINVYNWMAYQYRHVLYTHVPNGGFRNPKEGAKFKRMGVRRGIPDCLAFYPKGGYLGFACELKIKPNTVTPEQKEVLHMLNELGWYVCVAYSLVEYAKHFSKYMGDMKWEQLK